LLCRLATSVSPARLHTVHRLVFRRQWAAVVAACVVLGTIAVMAALLLVIMRIGLLVFVVMHELAVAFLYELPLTTHLSGWYGQPTVILLLATGVLILYGFHFSLGGRPMFGERLLED
jgi:hypothetical protein